MVVNIFVLAMAGWIATEASLPVQGTSPTVAQLRLAGALSDTGWVKLYADIKLKNKQKPRDYLLASGSFDRFNTKCFDFAYGQRTLARIMQEIQIQVRLEPIKKAVAL